MVSVFWVGACGCFLVPACVRHLLWVVGVGALWGWALSVFGEQTHCRVHVQHRVSVYRLLVVVACAAGLDRLWFGCGLCVVGCL